ncbi:zinc knuckle domain-containing protein [Ditylenchus destructor]|uniref:Zinc knuckle domain-containing protein n=1 Tax=Ditylenchus destructor TaxID=166010 RepID=A0AAD4R615_9BILA|nr:zinc knuckle domain-containing protein [Ditylenchus destructor]
MYYCSICKGTDHPSRYCPDDRDEEEEIVQPIPCRTVAQNDLKLAPIVCSLCGQTGHPSRLCQSTNDFAKRRATEAMNRELASDHCTLCKQTDHTSRSCPNASDLAKKCATGNLIYRACFNCGEFGHFSRDCTAPAGQNKELQYTGTNGSMDQSEETRS